jgi:hypothetical protein
MTCWQSLECVVAASSAQDALHSRPGPSHRKQGVTGGLSLHCAEAWHVYITWLGVPDASCRSKGSTWCQPDRAPAAGPPPAPASHYRPYPPRGAGRPTVHHCAHPQRSCPTTPPHQRPRQRWATASAQQVKGVLVCARTAPQGQASDAHAVNRCVCVCVWGGGGQAIDVCTIWVTCSSAIARQQQRGSAPAAWRAARSTTPVCVRLL